MTIRELKNKKIAILGAGVEGLSSEKYLRSKGLSITVLDKKDNPKCLSELSEFDVVVRSPGIKRNLPELMKFGQNGGVITSQTQLFLEWCPAKVIGVTGTKGKGTTSALIYEMLKESGKNVYLGGNIGVPPFDFLDQLNVQSKVVLEMSSFQLEDVTKSPHVAVMLMITNDHLDGYEDRNYHDSIEAYVDAKRNILRHQSSSDFAILNRDYPATNESDIYTEAQLFYVSRERDVERGCFVRNGKIFMKKDKQAADEELMNVSEVNLPGEHNLENVCAAVVAAKIEGVKDSDIVAVLKSFKGLEHHLEFCGEVRGVKFYDDSFSTVPDSAIAAVLSFKEPEILILGGSSKNSDFTQLGERINESKNIKAIIGIGIEWQKIKPFIKRSSIEIIEDLQTMREIVGNALVVAEEGDVVLLSPACASFGMFQDYKDRGNQFKKEVKKLQNV